MKSIDKEHSSVQETLTQAFPVLEMSCAACAVSVESILKSVQGVTEAHVNYANQSAVVTYDKKITSPPLFKKAIQSIGYDLVIDLQNADTIKEEAALQYFLDVKHRTIWSSVLSLPLIVLGMFYMDWYYTPYISMFIAAIVVFYFGSNFFESAWKQVRHGRASMDTLVALSTGIAFLFSMFNTFLPDYWHAKGFHAYVYYETASVIIAFISIGKLLEEQAKNKTSSAIKKLMGLKSKIVHVVIDGVIHELATSAVVTGNILLVKPGEKIPVDGIVTTGSSYVDESLISGEPIPLEKKANEKVYAGTINQKGSFYFKAEKVGDETVLAHIIKMVQEAQGSKAPVQKLVDKIAGVFVPVVLSIAVLTFIIWMLIGGDNAIANALLTSITVLVIACPCALGLATPTAIMVGIGKGAENNILIKDAECLQLAHKVNAIVLDKTGTITEGKPVVTNIVWEPDTESLALTSLLNTLESSSEHPLAGAVVNHLKKNSLSAVAIEKFESITARGVKAKYNNEDYFIGNRQLMNDNKILISKALELQALEFLSQAKTVIYFADGKNVKALIAIADIIKANAKAAIKILQEKGIDVYMLTGDNAQIATVIANEVGIKFYKAEVMPSDKSDFIKQLQNDGKIVAMVGDGINDSQALAQADVSIAMGRGSDIAMDTAKMTLITSDLMSIPKALTLSSKTVRNIRQNLFWAFIYNIIGIPIAAGVLYPIAGFLLDPMIAGGAMALSSVSVVLNSLRLRIVKI